ncbi:hypothetical protein ACPCTG_31795 [Streptomyces pseudogriseolus]|uniref:hypothetical protein n=1 Tax=Streptomyces pseudogriseolus TaxID=36817 RepID=UPI003FA1FAFC
MFNHDAGHNHLPAPGFVTDCPMCDAAKAARNQALAHLSEALLLLSQVQPADPSDDTPRTIRLNLAPIGLTGDDTSNCYSIDLTAKQAEALSDGIDSMNAYLGSSPDAPIDRILAETADAVTDAIPADQDRLTRFKGQLQGPDREAIASGEWSAAAVAQNDTDLWDKVNAAFTEMDAQGITDNVMDDRIADPMAVIRALDDVLGDVPYPYAEEDGDL